MDERFDDARSTLNSIRATRLAVQLGGPVGSLEDYSEHGPWIVAELRERGEPGRGRSSSMAHKQNPVAAVSAAACAIRTPGLVATMLAVMPGELERAAGSWQAEWETLSDLLRLTGSTLSWTAELVDRLEIDADRMRVNLGDAPFDAEPCAALVRRALAARSHA